MGTSRTHVAENRTVFTYEPEGWPRGVLTGYERDRGFFLEHVVTWPGSPPNVLIETILAGLDEAERREYRYIVLQIPHAFPIAGRLERLAVRFGFQQYTDDGEIAFYVRYRRPTDGRKRSQASADSTAA